jgi:hypothetical protein
MRRLVVWNVMTLDGCFEGKSPWDLGFLEAVWGVPSPDFVAKAAVQGRLERTAAAASQRGQPVQLGMNERREAPKAALVSGGP